jgi:AraC-like DNA-binding protein
LLKKELVMAGKPKPTKVTPQLAARLERARKHLITNACKGAGLRDAADVARLSPFYFHRLFRAHFRETPKDVSRRAQVEEAKRLILAGVPLREVSKRAGFAHQSHLSTRFRQIVGVTPTEWLKAREQPAAQKPRTQTMVTSVTSPRTAPE